MWLTAFELAVLGPSHPLRDAFVRLCKKNMCDTTVGAILLEIVEKPRGATDLVVAFFSCPLTLAAARVEITQRVHPKSPVWAVDDGLNFIREKLGGPPPVLWVGVGPEAPAVDGDFVALERSLDPLFYKVFEILDGLNLSRYPLRFVK